AETVKEGLGDFNNYKVPFVYSTNGELIWFEDLRSEESRSRPVQQFHTPKAVVEMYNSDSLRNSNWLLQNPPSSTKLRYYQKDAIQAIETAIENKLILI
ncbi:MAG: Type I site-specific deoxyribonuclease, partial [Candidatus Magasanikbacteria bacterium GW2011_GWA2_43_9]